MLFLLKDIDAIRIDGECAPSKFPYPAVPIHAVEQHPGTWNFPHNLHGSFLNGRII